MSYPNTDAEFDEWLESERQWEERRIIYEHVTEQCSRMRSPGDAIRLIEAFPDMRDYIITNTPKEFVHEVEIFYELA